MGVKWKTTKNMFPDIQKRLETLNGRKVIVGASGKDGWLISIHEYGLRIRVTDKMRAYLHGKGLHLKNSTTEIVIPERSFMRAGHDKEVNAVMKKVQMAVPLVIEGKMSEKQFLDLIGQMMSTKIKTYARDLSRPENHPFTIEGKGSNNPLVDTGQMIESITWEVE